MQKTPADAPVLLLYTVSQPRLLRITDTRRLATYRSRGPHEWGSRDTSPPSHVPEGGADLRGKGFTPPIMMLIFAAKVLQPCPLVFSLCDGCYAKGVSLSLDA